MLQIFGVHLTSFGSTTGMSLDCISIADVIWRSVKAVFFMMTPDHLITVAGIANDNMKKNVKIHV